jgi:hypothetical protein
MPFPNEVDIVPGDYAYGSGSADASSGLAAMPNDAASADVSEEEEEEAAGGTEVDADALAADIERRLAIAAPRGLDQTPMSFVVQFWELADDYEEDEDRYVCETDADKTYLPPHIVKQLCSEECTTPLRLTYDASESTDVIPRRGRCTVLAVLDGEVTTFVGMVSEVYDLDWTGLTHEDVVRDVREFEAKNANNKRVRWIAEVSESEPSLKRSRVGEQGEDNSAAVPATPDDASCAGEANSWENTTRRNWAVCTWDLTPAGTLNRFILKVPLNDERLRESLRAAIRAAHS